jgi:membrane fusion protein (multidrug efflux system)
VKVVQRIPVKVVLAAKEGDPPLRAGMSATVTVDTEYSRTARDLVPHW